MAQVFNRPSDNAIIQKKILFFVAGIVPTANEQTAISDLMQNDSYSVQVRNTQANYMIGPRLESCDGVAASTPAAIPAPYQTLVQAGTLKDYSGESGGGPQSFQVFMQPNPPHVGKTAQLSAISESEAGAVADVTAGGAVTYASNNAAVASVTPAGLVTGVAVGAAVITSTYTFAAGEPPVVVNTPVNVAA